MIVKVQLSLHTTAPTQQVLIQNSTKNVTYMGDATPDLIARMNGRDKAYFKARMKGTVVVIGRRVGDQSW